MAAIVMMKRREEHPPAPRRPIADGAAPPTSVRLEAQRQAEARLTLCAAQADRLGERLKADDQPLLFSRLKQSLLTGSHRQKPSQSEDDLSSSNKVFCSTCISEGDLQIKLSGIS